MRAAASVSRKAEVKSEIASDRLGVAGPSATGREEEIRAFAGAPKGQEKGKPASSGARISDGSMKTGRNHHRGVESDPPVAAGTIVGDNVVRKLMIVKEIVAHQSGQLSQLAHP
jgi:hypothetical protein